MARKIDLVVIHCSDSPNGRTLFTGSPGEPGFVTPVQEIDRWHRERGFKRWSLWRKLQEPTLTSIGYHFVIYTRGAVANGRHLDEVGAHAHGYNTGSIGICLIGCDQFARAQWDALRDLLCGYARQIEPPRPGVARRYHNPTPAETRDIFARLGVRVVGHSELDPAKTCPNFDVRAWLDCGMQPPAGQIYPDNAEGATA